MPKQKPIIKLQRAVEKHYPGLELPEDISYVRPFYEALIDFHCLDGKMYNDGFLRVEIGYKYGSTHYKEYQKGLEAAEAYKKNTKYLKRVEAA